METKSAFEKFDELQFDWRSKAFIREAAKWAKFLSIVGFIGVALMIIIALSLIIFGVSGSAATGSMLPFGSSVLIVVIYAAFGLLYFVPLYYLYKFAVNAGNAVNTNNTAALSESLKYLKSHYKFMGILVIVILSIYVMIFLIGILGALGSSL